MFFTWNHWISQILTFSSLIFLIPLHVSILHSSSLFMHAIRYMWFHISTSIISSSQVPISPFPAPLSLLPGKKTVVWGREHRYTISIWMYSLFDLYHLSLFPIAWGMVAKSACCCCSWVSRRCFKATISNWCYWWKWIDHKCWANNGWYWIFVLFIIC